MLYFLAYAVGTLGRKLGEEARAAEAIHDIVQMQPPEDRARVKATLLADKPGLLKELDRREDEIWKEARRIAWERKSPTQKVVSSVFKLLWYAFWIACAIGICVGIYQEIFMPQGG
jgi:hypothetical protein